MKNTKRIKWLDFGKGLAILCVIISHSLMFTSNQCFPLLVGFLNVFMMPIFFGISGFLYKPVKDVKGYNILIYKKVTSFIIPYLLFTFVVFGYYKLGLATTDEGDPHYSNILSIFTCHQNSYLWFLYVLFMIFIFISSINIIFNKCNLCIKFIILIIIILILGSFKWYFNGIKPFILWMICFLFGYIIKRYKLLLYFKNKLLSYIIFILWVIACIFNKMDMINLGNMNYVISHLFMISSIIIFFIIFKDLKDSTLFNYFCKYGKYTLLIYLVQQPIILFIVHFIPFRNNFMGVSVFIISLLLTIISCNVFLKIRLIKFMFYPRGYIDNVISIWNHKR